MASKQQSLSAVSLKSLLWETLQQVKCGDMTPAQGSAVASQAREILRTVKTQLNIFSQSGSSVADELIDFAKPGAKPQQ